MLEDADEGFTRVVAGIDAYQTSTGKYLTSEQIREEIEILRSIYEHDRANTHLAHRIGRLAMAVGDWPRAVASFRRAKKSNYAPFLRDLGIALCKANGQRPKSAPYREGQASLKQAIQLDRQDADAVAALAGSYKHDETKSVELYKQAFEIDPTNPYPLGCYLEQKIAAEKNTRFVTPLRPSLQAAIVRCREQADIGVNLPWAFYDMGKFYLLLGKTDESLAAFAKAAQLSTAQHMIDAALESVETLRRVGRELPALEWVRRLLLVAKAARFPKSTVDSRLRRLATPRVATIAAPVVIVAGGCDPRVRQRMKSYRPLLLTAFDGFRGTIVSGGTTAGISGLVGDIGARYRDAIHTIGYVPVSLPPDADLERTPDRYREIRRTSGKNFSPLEPLQNWIDLLVSGVDPKTVKVIGINGGRIAAFEYRLALALGARVAVLEQSGREAGAIEVDPDWGRSPGLAPMPLDPMSVQTFLHAERRELDAPTRDTLAQAIHAKYRETKQNEAVTSDPRGKNWEQLEDLFKESNRQQADDIERKLRAIGCTVHRVTDRDISLMKFSKAEIEVMAEMEHARWTVERLLDGWRLGERKDTVRKISPYLVSWAELPEAIKGWDRRTVAAIPEFLSQVGLEVRRAATDSAR